MQCPLSATSFVHFFLWQSSVDRVDKYEYKSVRKGLIYYSHGNEEEGKAHR